jgi:hydrogenase maturation protein HypF
MDVRLRARGQVQGVGFRPFVALLARRLGLCGFVRNDAAGAEIHLQGAPDQIAAFETALHAELPPPGRIDRLTREPAEPPGTLDGFAILHSETGSREADVTVDCALCPSCRRELFDPGDRRRGHPLITCTHCGPRFSILVRVPWDRPNTTMADFPMCPECAREYASPEDRRYHAQPLCCPACGPRWHLLLPSGEPIAGPPFERAAGILAEGGALAVKGLGGYHLSVRADREEAVERLRRRKGRDAKPFALMVGDLALAERLVRLSAAGRAALTGIVAPIVLAERRGGAGIAPSVAPGTHRLGVMLPSTPIQHLLFAEPALRGVPLVMTSGNRADEPIVIDDAQARSRLGPMCEALLMHERPIERPIDDSVLLDFGEGAPLPVRRARGLVPSAIALDVDPTLDGMALGGDLKSVVGVLRHGRAILSQHLGDLEHLQSQQAMGRAAADLVDLFGADPDFVAHDLHPDYHSHAHARRLAQARGVGLVAVQHHAAHAAAVLAEHGYDGPAVAIVCDGTGYGSDGTVWGGELLTGDLGGFERRGRLRPFPLAGGEAAARDARRPAMALLALAFGDGFADHPAARALVPSVDERRVLARMISSGVHAPQASSTGRLFDGVAALLGLASGNRFEAQAPLALEAAAREVASGETGPGFSLRRAGDLDELDPAPFVRWLVDERSRGAPATLLAAAFHDALAEGWARLAAETAGARGVRTIALSGGAFCNERLTRRVTGRLEGAGLRVLRHERVPCNDGGLALGQLALAARAMTRS